MAWFVGSLTILWYCLKGHEGSHVVKDRPWYTAEVTPTFTDISGRYDCRCGSTRFMESPMRNRPHRNAFKACSTGWRLWVEGPKV